MTEILEKYKKTLQDNFFSKSTIDAYISDIKKFLEFLPEENLQLIPGEILNYKVHLKENYKVSTVNRKISALNEFFKIFDIDGLVPASVSLGANWKKYASIYNTSSIFFQFQKVTIQYI